MIILTIPSTLSLRSILRLIIGILTLLWCFSALAESNQSTDVVIMISPDTFQYNTETAATNVFQHHSARKINISQAAVKEFKQMVLELRKNNITVIVLPSRKDVITPDAVFPNNWFSVHDVNGKVTLVLYPMLAKDRRLERQVSALKSILKTKNISVEKTIDLTGFEKANQALEGTGSLVLDRVHKVAFASLSPRTNSTVLAKFLEKMHYKPIIFHSYDKEKLIYHTNVMLSIGSHFAVVAADSITSPSERSKVLSDLKNLHKNVIIITLQQMENMAGNIIELRSTDGQSKILMSQTAFRAFTPEQRKKLEKFGKLIIVNIPLIEKLGGGSARCMITEVFHQRLR